MLRPMWFYTVSQVVFWFLNIFSLLPIGLSWFLVMPDSTMLDLLLGECGVSPTMADEVSVRSAPRRCKFVYQ